MAARRLRDRLVVRLIGFGIVLILAGLVGRLLILSGTLREELQGVLAAQQQSLANYVAADIDGKIGARRQLLATLATELPVELLRRPQQLEAWLGLRHGVAPLFTGGLLVIPEHGQGAIADFPHLAGRHELDFSSRDWFRTARDEAKFAIGTPGLGRISRQGIIAMAAPIRDAEGRVIAVISGITALDTPGFLDLIQNNTIGKTGGFLLVSPRDRLFVAASMASMRLQPTPAPGRNPLHDRAMAGWRGAGITVNAFGVEELAAIAGVPSADWFVVARLPAEEAFEPVHKIRYLLLRNSVWLAAFTILVLVIYLSHVFRPMREAARQMHRMADGEAPLAALPITRRDEVGEMVEAFNSLLRELRESDARMAHLAHHDALTGLPNRLSFLASVQQNAALAKRQNLVLALMFIDLDHFKPINDRLGHEAGDQLLRQVAERLSLSVRKADVVARLGGDEFVVLLTNLANRDRLATIAEKLIAALSAPYVIHDAEVEIGASIGVAIYPDDAEDIDALIAQADAAMYDAKRLGRNQCRFAHKAD